MGKIGLMTSADLRAAFLRLRTSWWPVLQAAIASSLAWWITHDVLNHPQPFFAPIAAAISLSATVGRRWRNAVQMRFGVTLGIAVSEAVPRLLRSGALPPAVASPPPIGAAGR